MRRCHGCGTVISGRSDREFCSSACRTRQHRLRQVPPSERRERLGNLVELVSAASGEVALLNGIARAARSDWRAAAFLLERRHPERWSLTRRGGSDDDDLIGSFNDPPELRP